MSPVIPQSILPCGMADGLPISMMMFGKHFDDKTVIPSSTLLRISETGERCEYAARSVVKWISTEHPEPPPRPGTHTDLVLEAAGFTAEQLAELRSTKVIG